MPNTLLRPAAYDPYGEPAPAVRAAARAAAHPFDRRLRVPVMLFWALALALVAGRLVLPVDLPGGPAAIAVHPVATPS
jgi:hypothetical protein